MKLIWKVSSADVFVVRSLHERMKNRTLVRVRYARNVTGKKRAPCSREAIWTAIVRCHLSTQQRSDPSSKSTRIAAEKPFPFALERFQKADDPAEKARSIFADFGGLYRSEKIARAIAQNLEWLEGGAWERLEEVWQELETEASIQAERAAADLVADNMREFGPKQSRNLWQLLGLSKYETPLDSRVVKWLNREIEFPIKLSAAGLHDRGFYLFVMEGVQQLCAAADLLPCIFDAIVFTSFTREEWDEGSLVW